MNKGSFLKMVLLISGIFSLIAFGFFVFDSKISFADRDDGDDDRYGRYEDDDDDDEDRYEYQVQQPIVNSPIVETPAPDPKKYDADSDGVADAFDKHPGEDDFIFMVEDKNFDGVADDLEFLKIVR